MAELFVSPIIEVVLDKLASFESLNIIRNVFGVGNIKKLTKMLDLVQRALEDAEEKLPSDPSVGIWLSNLKDIAYDALYLLLDHERGGLMFSRMREPEKIRFVVTELERIVDKVVPLLITGGNQPPVSIQGSRRESSYPVKESQVYGRDEDKGNVVKLLLSDCQAYAQDGDHVPCVVIEGMTAIGKTTLAQLAFNDQEVTRHFDVKVWVFVSHHFDAKKILTAIVESITNDSCSLSNLPALHLAVERLLKDKRYLIVLDDVWTERKDEWDKLTPLLNGCTAKYGSRILITTQNKRVAPAMNVSEHLRYSLKGLSEDHCWDLFKRLAFKPGEEEKYPRLWLIGQQIARKCAGVALAANSLGSLLHLKRDEREWLYIRDNELWNLDEAESGILPALQLSYSRLPQQLRQCFAFCSIFPRGYEIKKEKLIHLWMAEGLVSDKDNKRAEDIGNNYFNYLLWMSFFEEEKQCDDGVVIGYKMHDVIYNLARSIAKSEYAILDRSISAPRNVAKIRHSSIVCHFDSPMIPEELYEAKGLLTLFLFSGGNFHTVPRKLFSNFQYLFVLDLSGSGVEVFEGKFLSQLVHLKFLDLSYTQIRELPSDISALHRLRTLNLSHCYHLVRIELQELLHLKHVNNAGCVALTTMGRMPRLAKHIIIELLLLSPNIEILPLFVVEKSVDMMLLRNIKLRGNLKITRLRNVCFASDAQHANLKQKFDLESLGLLWGNDDHRSNINPDEASVFIGFKERSLARSSGSSSEQGPQSDPLVAKDILTNLHPPPNLKILGINGYPGIEFPSWEVPRYLNVIQLIGLKNIQHLPVLGDLQSLNSLSLQEMHALRSIEREFYGTQPSIFPALRELTLIDFPVLEEWSSPTVADAFPSLRKLIISGCPQLIEIPVHFNCIQHLELRRCKATLVHSFRGLTSLETLVIKEVGDLFDFPRPFPGNNPRLTTLEIKSCSKLSALPEEMESLTSLKSLAIRWCEELTYLPIDLPKLTALESLEIGDCPSLECLPNIGTGGFSNLRTLSIETCNSLTFLPRGLQYLTSLEHLTIIFCPNLQAFPQGVEHLSSLRSLTIIACDNLTSLPEGLQNLSTVQNLEIRSCPAVQALPEWIEKLVLLRSLAISGCENITFLPNGIKCLTALQHLSIHDCPRLLERCRRESGEDWPKIAHVPHKHIGPPEQRHQSEAGSSSST